MKTKLQLAVIFLALAWYLNDPVPEGFSEPWKLRIAMVLSKVASNIFWWLDKLRIQSYKDGLSSMITEQSVIIPDHITIENIIFDGVEVRMYRLKDQSHDTLPGLVFYHGGGWTLLNAKFDDNQMITILQEINMIIVSVEYTLAPEAIFPVPLEQCVTATKHFLTNANKYGVDPKRIAIGGASAGGNLAAAVALKLRDDKFSPMPKRQLLVYPVLQAVDFSLPSYMQNKYGPFLDRHLMAWFVSQYITGSKKYTSAILNNNHVTPGAKQLIYNDYLWHDDIDKEYKYAPYYKPSMDTGSSKIWNEIKDVIMNPYFAPLLAKDLTDLPDAFVFTAQYDILRDEGMLYVKRLRKAGVKVSHVHSETGFHGVPTIFQEGRYCWEKITEDLQINL